MRLGLKMQTHENDLKNQIDFHRDQLAKLEHELSLARLAELKKDLKLIYVEFRTGDNLKDHITQGRRFYFQNNEIQKLIDHLEKLK